MKQNYDWSQNSELRELENRYPDPDRVWPGFVWLAVIIVLTLGFLFAASRAFAIECIGDGHLVWSGKDYSCKSKEDEKLLDAVRNGLSLSVNTCFNIYTQGALNPIQDERLRTCLGRVFRGFELAREMLNKERHHGK